MSAPYYVNLYGGMLVSEDYPGIGSGVVRKVYTTADARLATPFASFAQADACAKYAVKRLYPPDLRYFAILEVSNG